MLMLSYTRVCFQSLPVPAALGHVLDSSDDEVDSGDDGEDDEPEPQKDVDLFIQNVHS